MICPLLKRTGLDRTECNFPVLCTPPAYCVWAKFHMLDPVTGKPAGDYRQSQAEPGSSGQKDLFA